MMAQRQRLSILLFLGIAFVAIALLSTGLSKVHFEPGKSINLLGLLLQKLRSFSAAPAPEFYADTPTIGWLRPFFWAMLIFSIVYAIVSPQSRKQLLRTFIMVCFLVFLLNRLSDRLTGGTEGRAQGAAAAPAEVKLPDPPAFVSNPPDWFLALADMVLALLILGTIWFFWRHLRPKPGAQALLVREAEAALTDLEGGSDLRDVVLRCYAKMSQVLRESRNIERRSAMTPREFESHLAEVGVRDEHIRRLTRLFEGVRYGAKPAGGRAQREAMDCLRAIVRAYGKTA
jgi:hypothetical protein